MLVRVRIMLSLSCAGRTIAGAVGKLAVNKLVIDDFLNQVPHPSGRRRRKASRRRLAGIRQHQYGRFLGRRLGPCSGNFLRCVVNVLSAFWYMEYISDVRDAPR